MVFVEEMEINKTGAVSSDETDDDNEYEEDEKEGTSIYSNIMTNLISIAKGDESSVQEIRSVPTDLPKRQFKHHKGIDWVFPNFCK